MQYVILFINNIMPYCSCNLLRSWRSLLFLFLFFFLLKQPYTSSFNITVHWSSYKIFDKCYRQDHPQEMWFIYKLYVIKRQEAFGSQRSPDKQFSKKDARAHAFLHKKNLIVGAPSRRKIMVNRRNLLAIGQLMERLSFLWIYLHLLYYQHQIKKTKLFILEGT